MQARAEAFRRAMVEAGWEIDFERFRAIIDGGGTILAAADVYAYLYVKFVGPGSPIASGFALDTKIEVRKSDYLLPGQIAAIKL